MVYQGDPPSTDLSTPGGVPKTCHFFYVPITPCVEVFGTTAGDCAMAPAIWGIGTRRKGS